MQQMLLSSFVFTLYLVSTCYAGVLTQRDTLDSNSRTEQRYTILDNDWGSTSFIPFLIALNADMNVLGLTGDTANTWALQATLHALGTLEHGDLSCIPVALGVTHPLEFTLERYKVWTQLWGTIPWAGAYAPQNLTLQAEGNDPTGGNPNTISRSAFIEGFPTHSYIGTSAPEFMIEQVFKYPGKVSIYSAGALTNIATAISLNSSFASTAKELVIMGGYIGLDLFRLHNRIDDDIGTDFNFFIDPEAAHIAVTADWSSITIAGNVANLQYLTQSQVNHITSFHSSLYNDLLVDYELDFPLWDETAAAIMAYPELVTSNTIAYMDVSTAFDSPFYGSAFLWSKDFAPAHVREVNYVTAIDQTAFSNILSETLINPKQCRHGRPVDV